MGWVLPVGTPGGINSGFAATQGPGGIVRFGSALVFLDTDSYRLWQHAAIGAEIEDVVNWGIQERIADAHGLVRALVEARLLIEAGPGLGSAVGGLAIRLIGECMGNGIDAGSRFVVVGTGGVRVEVDLFFFEVLLRCDGVSPISNICSELERARPGVLDRPLVDIIAEGLPLLVRHGVVRLDAVAR